MPWLHGLSEPPTHSSELMLCSPHRTNGTLPDQASGLLHPPLLTSTDSPEPQVGASEHFGGDPAECGAFITNCTFLSLKRIQRETSHPWGAEEWERQMPACPLFQVFADGHPPCQAPSCRGW